MEDAPEQIQRMLESLYRHTSVVVRLDVILRAEEMDLPQEALHIVALLPPGRYTRSRLCDQMNSAIVAQGLNRLLGTHD
ncbi:MAG: hypothetical protein PF636_05490 [Actinomycetota bacterium]|nr:hypothetical protein [Actinomycetota bacterium]